MSSDGWGSSFKPLLKQSETATLIYSGPNQFPEINHVRLFEEAAPISEQAWGNISLRKITEYKPVEGHPVTKDDLAGGPVFEDAALHGIGFSLDGKHVPLEKVYTNLPPTHDPYTNPNAQLYYSCNCGAILDPGTKRFAELNNCASKAGWKIRFSDKGYTPYCVECGKGVE